MAITVAPGAGDLAAELVGAFVLHVTECSDEDAAALALADARQPIARLAGAANATGIGPVLSNPLLGPEGVLLRVTQLDVDPDLAATVPDIVAAALERAGVANAVVDVLDPRGPLDDLDLCANAVVLRVFPIPAGEAGVIPSSWVELAAEWVLGELGPDDVVPMRLLGAPFEVSVADAPAVLHHAARARAWCDLVHGDSGDRIRTASLTFGRLPHLAVAAGGPGCDEDALLARFELLCEAAQELHGEVAYACVDLEPTFGELGAGISDDGWKARGGAAPNVVAGELVDLCVPDAFPYQVLGPRHMARLRDAATTAPEQTAPVGEHLDDGRTALAIGDPLDWLPGLDTRDEAQQAGWTQLAPLLLRPAELDELLAERPLRPPSLQVGATAAAAGGQIDLEAIVLEPTPHARRGLHLTLLELVAWLAHEHHSDSPVTVSPVVAVFARWFASSLEPALRQQLKKRARTLIGTSGARRRDDGMSADDVARTWLATDWLLRAQAPTWLRAAGHLVVAEQLEHLGPTDDPAELQQAVELLAAVLAAPDRPDASGGHRPDPTLAPRLVWDAWEHASEAGGWVAASEAAGIGLPEDLAYAVEMRVIEGTRKERVRAQLAADGASLVDHVRASAWRALAVTAWARGWEALETTVDDTARVAFATAVDRARRAAIGRDGVDVDTYDLSVEAAEDAARRVLADQARRPGSRGGDTESAWEAAIEGGRSAAGTEPWAEMLDLTRDVVEDGPWAAGTRAAAAAVDAVMATAPSLVERAVGAAFAREASGFAAREVALLAAGAALREGATEAEAAVRTRAALSPTIDILRDAALGLLDALIEGNDAFEDELVDDDGPVADESRARRSTDDEWAADDGADEGADEDNLATGQPA